VLGEQVSQGGERELGKAAFFRPETGSAAMEYFLMTNGRSYIRPPAWPGALYLALLLPRFEEERVEKARDQFSRSSWRRS